VRPDLGVYMDSLQRDCAEMAEAAAGNLDARVPACPDWNVRQLLQHTGEVLYFWTTIADRQLENPREVENIDVPDDETELLPWFHQIADHAVKVLSTSDPGAHVYTWAPHKDVGFIQRRMAQELAVHGWDARSSVGDAPRPIDPLIATDGINEFFDTFWHGYDSRKGPERSGTVHLHQTDGDGEWFVRYDKTGLEFNHEHAKGDAAVQATASDLLLMLWRRVPTDSDALEVFGDKQKLDEFVGWIDLS
jgi:uncharacterized protein (TIGR03083 family)